METHQGQRGVFNARDGTTLYYESYGSGRPILFCYGLLCRREHWRHQLAHFQKHYRIILFDYRGHQFSATPANDQNLTLEWCARDIQDVMNHLQLEEAVCFGHSMGVPILSQFLPWEPQRVKAAVFICGTVTNPFKTMFYSSRMDSVYRWAESLYETAPFIMNQIWSKFTEHNRLSYFLTSQLGFNANRAERADVLRYMEGVNKTPFSTFYSLMHDYTRFDGRKKLNEIQCPVQVLAGEQDCITPFEIQKELYSLLPKAEFFTIPAGSHNAHMDFPDIVNMGIDGFLKRVGYV